MNDEFEFSAELWEADAEASWVFVTVPIGIADEIADLVPGRPGFGSVRVRVRTGDVEWHTSLFPSSAAGSYGLPIKRSVREQAGISAGQTAEFAVRVILD